jgi:signal transduction histidine kinase
LRRWFEPFFRTAASRQSEVSGNGLGLAVARALARTNGWDLQIYERENGVEATLTIGSRALALAAEL